jgi:tetratricopeptide (TPR) repeat protein
MAERSMAGLKDERMPVKLTSMRNWKASVLLLPALCAVLFLVSCSWPKIYILKDPLTPQEHLNLGVTYEKQGDFENAIREYEMAAKKIPQGSLFLGNVYFQKGELDQAEKYYKEALEKEPDNPDALNNLAWLYYTKRENLDEAERLASRAIEINPAKKGIYEDTLKKIREVKKTKP